MSTRHGLRLSTRASEAAKGEELRKKSEDHEETEDTKHDGKQDDKHDNEQDNQQISTTTTQKPSKPDGIKSPDLIIDVPPLQRKLSPETIQLLNKPISTSNVISPIDFQLSKVVGLMLSSQNLSYSQEFLTEVTDLSIIYLHDIIDSLRKFTELQRRSRPSIGDTRLLLRTKGIPTLHLYDEYVKSKQFSKRNELNVIDQQTNHIIQELDTATYQLDKEDPSLPFFANESYEITQLVPKSAGKPIYIPEDFPDLPPDYTYQKTSEYMELVDDLKEIRLKSVEESRMTDESLYNLIENDDRIWKTNFEQELAQDIESDEESIISANGQDKNTDVETPVNIGDEPEIKQFGEEPDKPQSGKAFDFEEYAKKRKNIIEKRKLATEKKRRLRQENIFMIAEKKYSPYAASIPSEDDDKFFKDVISKEFKSIIKAVRVAETKKQLQIAEILEKRKQQEKEKSEQIEFGFSFNTNTNIDDSESEDEGEVDIQFDSEQPEKLNTEEVLTVEPDDKKVHFEMPETERNLADIEDQGDIEVNEDNAGETDLADISIDEEEAENVLNGQTEDENGHIGEEEADIDSDDFADLEDVIEAEIEPGEKVEQPENIAPAVDAFEEESDEDLEDV